jgi:predicted transcriptional regulator
VKSPSHDRQSIPQSLIPKIIKLKKIKETKKKKTEGLREKTLLQFVEFSL